MRLDLSRTELELRARVSALTSTPRMASWRCASLRRRSSAASSASAITCGTVNNT